jgi:hypothetical protein
VHRGEACAKRELGVHAVDPRDVRVGDEYDLAVAGNELAELLQRPDADVDGSGGECDAFEIGRDRVGGLAVEGLTFLIQRAEQPLLLGERPVEPANAFPGRRRLHLDVHRECLLAKGTADSRARHGSAAESDDRRPTLAQRLQRRLLLENPELDLAALREDLRDRPTYIAFDHPVEVDELAAESGGDLHAQRRLAGAHEADEGEVAV